MASNYGLNFGFLRSSEEVRMAEGRYKVPADATLLLGTAIQVDDSGDPGTDGYLAVCASDAKPVTGYAGLLLQELEWSRSIYESAVNLMDSFMYGTAKPNQLALITGGAGTKVWFKNTDAQDNPARADGRSIAAVSMFDSTDVAVGAELGWDGSLWHEVGDGGLSNSWMKVTAYNEDLALVEAVLLA